MRGVPPPDLEEIEQLRGEEIWRIAWCYQIERRRRSDDECQTVEVVVMHHHDLGWRIVAKDEDRNISALGNPGSDLSVVMHTVHWYELDGPARPPNPRGLG